MSENTEAATTPARAVDFAAVSRVARVADLREIRLSQISATGHPARGVLVPSWNHACEVSALEKEHLNVTCTYEFVVKSEGTEVARVGLQYVLYYSLLAEPGPDPKDADEFAFANGTFHSWPFVRQLLFDMTSRLGFPPFTLPVFLFNPKTNPKKPPSEPTQAAPPATEASANGD